MVVSLLITPATAAVTPLQGEIGVINGNIDPNWIRFTYPVQPHALARGRGQRRVLVHRHADRHPGGRAAAR